MHYPEKYFNDFLKEILNQQISMKEYLIQSMQDKYSTFSLNQQFKQMPDNLRVDFVLADALNTCFMSSESSDRYELPAMSLSMLIMELIRDPNIQTIVKNETPQQDI